jgi:signal transduction histidine kinase
MLVMLVSVTAVLLVIMGTVSTYLLARRVDGHIEQISGRLSQQAGILANDPALLAKDPSRALGGYAVVEIPVAPQLKVVQLSKGLLSSQLAAAVRRRLAAPGAAAFHAQVLDGQLTSSYPADCAQFPYISCQPFDISPAIQVASSWTDKAGNGPSGKTDPAIFIVGQAVSRGPSQVRSFLVAELLTGAALIALLALAGEWLIGQGLEPLDEMTRTAKEITSRGDLTARMPDVNQQTEVGKLGASINTMLDRIQQSFSSRLRSEQKVREFAADASHELRTPLTTIRGYAELYRQGALGPDELPNAMRRIEQESERMSTLVAELLELARLDRTSSLDLAETDLATVVRDAVADAAAVEPLRPVRAEAPPRLVAVVDEPRIRQVLANLLGNVSAHTPKTAPVAVRLGQITGGVLIEVADAGPGMSTEDAIRAFDRFHRAADRPVQHSANGNGDMNGSGRHSGSGLGLSIVQAIANAHGGRATLESWPGRGTKVRVWLPVRIVP